jgi:hypothetical protein
VGGNPYLYDGQYYRIKTANTNQITSNGAELEGRVKINNWVYVYGGGSVGFETKVDQFKTTIQNQVVNNEGGNLFNADKEMLSYPKYLVTVGANFDIAGLVINLHCRSWAEMWTKYANGYEKLGPESFVDLNILYKEAFSVKNLECSLYSKNIFNNNNARTAMPALGGYYTDIEGATVGFKLSYKM